VFTVGPHGASRPERSGNGRAGDAEDLDAIWSIIGGTLIGGTLAKLRHIGDGPKRRRVKNMIAIPFSRPCPEGCTLPRLVTTAISGLS